MRAEEWRRGGRGRRIPGEVRAEIGRRLRGGETWREVGAAVSVSKATIARILNEAGGMAPRWQGRSPYRLSVADREEISRGLVAGDSLRVIAARLGRHPSTVSREVKVNGGRDHYRAWAADRRACEEARRPKDGKLASNAQLAAVVEAHLEQTWSPEQIAARLPGEFPDDVEMRVSHETIYQTLFVQGRGGLRKELTACLRSGRTRRRPRPRHSPGSVNQGKGKLQDMVMISERPAEAEDRAVPGHWEGDLIMGAGNRSAIGTLVERTTRYVMLLHLPDGHSAEAVRDAMTAKILTLPVSLRRSITWDQGKEMALHAQFSVDTGVQIFFCDPHSPWLRGSNENTNGLLRQYFPKGTDLSVHSAAHLDAVADELNGRPRQTLGWMTPSEKFHQLVALAA
jgi:transposase, IS30 family